MHERWMKLADDLSQNCKDPANIGCAIVKDDELISVGWNRVATNVEEVEARQTHKRAKQYWVEHAERIAVYQAARNGVSTKGATAYVNVSPHSVCTICLRALIESGIVCIVGNTRDLPTKNVRDNSDINQMMIDEAGIETITIESSWQTTI